MTVGPQFCSQACYQAFMMPGSSDASAEHCAPSPLLFPPSPAPPSPLRSPAPSPPAVSASPTVSASPAAFAPSVGWPTPTAPADAPPSWTAALYADYVAAFRALVALGHPTAAGRLMDALHQDPSRPPTAGTGASQALRALGLDALNRLPCAHITQLFA